MHPYTKFKEEQKALAKHIRWMKDNRKPSMCDASAEVLQSRWNKPHEVASFTAKNLGQDFRHRHIAACEMKGLTREQIEPSVKEGNEADENRINTIKATLQEALDKHYAETDNAA